MSTPLYIFALTNYDEKHFKNNIFNFKYLPPRSACDIYGRSFIILSKNVITYGKELVICQLVLKINYIFDIYLHQQQIVFNCILDDRSSSSKKWIWCILYGV